MANLLHTIKMHFIFAPSIVSEIFIFHRMSFSSSTLYVECLDSPIGIIENIGSHISGSERPIATKFELWPICHTPLMHFIFAPIIVSEIFIFQKKISLKETLHLREFKWRHISETVRVVDLPFSSKSLGPAHAHGCLHSEHEIKGVGNSNTQASKLLFITLVLLIATPWNNA